MNIKDIVFTYFGKYFQIYDENRNLDPDDKNRGTLQRYEEILGTEIDTYLLPKIVDILQNIIPNPLILDVFVPLWEQSLGLSEPLYDDLEIRKKVLVYMPKLNRNRGKLINYQFLFLQLGFTVELDVIFEQGSFDDGTFDANTFDTYASINAEYTIILSQLFPFPITPEIEDQVARIILYNNPIHATVTNVIYVGDGEGEVTLDTNTLNFANTRLSQNETLQFEIENTGTGLLIVDDITAPEGFTASPTDFNLIPLATQIVNVDFEPTEEKVYSGDVEIISDAVSSPDAVSVDGIAFSNSLHFDQINDYVASNNIATPYTQFERTQPWTFFCTIDVTQVNQRSNIFESRGGPNRTGINIYISQGRVNVTIANRDFNGGSDRIRIRFNNSISVGKNTIQILYDGGSNAATMQCYVNGVAQVPNIQTNDLISSIVFSDTFYVGFNTQTGNDQMRESNVRWLSFVDYVKSISEIASDNDLNRQTSGIGNFLLALDFNQDAGLTFNSVDNNSYQMDIFGQPFGDWEPY